MDNPTPLKQCKRCGELKPATFEYFYRESKSGGLRSNCRACFAASVDYDKRRQQYKEKQVIVPLGVTTKQCSVCKELKLLNSFTPSKSGLYGRSAVCKDCRNAKIRACTKRKNETPEAIQAASEKREKMLAERAARALEMKEAKQLYMREWRRNNRLKLKTYKAKERAIRKAAPGNFTAKDVELQFQQQEGKCYWCGKRLKKSGSDKFHVDHIFALARGGTNDARNICCACPFCNQSKNAKSPLEFAGRLF